MTPSFIVRTPCDSRSETAAGSVRGLSAGRTRRRQCRQTQLLPGLVHDERRHRVEEPVDERLLGGREAGPGREQKAGQARQGEAAEPT